jgi:two-component system chemotaxis response regulator CheB
LESDPELRVVGRAKNGMEALALAIELRPDVITMDINMPVMDGYEATREIMIRAPAPIVIVSGSVNRRDVELALNATRAGAVIAIPKPDSPHSPDFDAQRRQLIATVKAMSRDKVVRRWATPVGSTPPAPVEQVRPTGMKLVAIVASTGGPAAVQRILSDLPREFPAPIVVVQHIADGFVGGLADWLNTSCNMRVKVAESTELLQARTVYLAPDGRHLGITPALRIALSDDPPIGAFRPSGTYLFDSVAYACGSSTVGVALTGMGADGVAGLRRLKGAGGYVIAQDEQTSVVWGIPGEATRAGLIDTVLAIGMIGARLSEIVTGGRDGNSRSHR